MTITQLIQTSPTKANELFSQLADTSDGAIKTREKLFAELKDELETLASLEEKHLFPVLRKHQETKGHRQLDRRLSAVGQLAGVGAALVRD
jgi:hemerythrin HHE cation binding domain-containing protein